MIEGIPMVKKTSVVVGLALLALGGCGKSDREPTHPVRGQVAYNGKPIPHAIVVFHPLTEPGKNVPRPRATVNADGTFVLATYEASDGAPAGQYAVTIEWWQSNEKAAPDAPPSNRLPPRYAKTATSGLRVRVEPGDNQIPTIQLRK
jgi:hypothetical protein